MNQRRPLKELNLLDRFLFDETMEDSETSASDREGIENFDRKQADPLGCICHG